MCDEYQHFATVGESEPSGDEKFFSLLPPTQVHSHRRDAKHQLIEVRAARRNLATLLQTFRTKIFLALSDDSPPRPQVISAEGRTVEGQLQHLRERTRRPCQPLTGKALAHGQHHRVEELQHPERTFASTSRPSRN